MDTGLKITRSKVQKRLPKKLGTLTDIRYKLKLQKEALEKELREVTKEIGLVEDAVFLQLKNQDDLSGVRGKYAQISISPREYPRIDDEQQAYLFIKKGKGTSRFHFLQKRFSITAIREYEEETGKSVPGITIDTKKVLSVTKLK